MEMNNIKLSDHQVSVISMGLCSLLKLVEDDRTNDNICTRLGVSLNDVKSVFDELCYKVFDGEKTIKESIQFSSDAFKSFKDHL